MYVQRNIQARSRNQCCCGKTIHITYSNRVSVAVVIQHAERMRRIILSSVDYPAVQHFFTLSRKQLNFQKKEKKVTESEMCVLIFSTTFV